MENEQPSVPIDEYLRNMYPSASDEELKQYLTWIEQRRSDRLPPSEEIKEYVKLKAEFDALKDKVDSLKETIVKQKQRVGIDFSLLNVTMSNRRTVDYRRIYRWASFKFDKELVEYMTIKSIDVTKFKELEAKGLITYDELPISCYSETPTWTLRTIKEKKKK